MEDSPAEGGGGDGDGDGDGEGEGEGGGGERAREKRGGRAREQKRPESPPNYERINFWGNARLSRPHIFKPQPP